VRELTLAMTAASSTVTISTSASQAAHHALATTAADDQHLLGLNCDLGSFGLAHFVSLCRWPIVAAEAQCYTPSFSNQCPVSGISSAKFCLDVFKKTLKISQFFSRR
jgi:hypothetical protein